MTRSRWKREGDSWESQVYPGWAVHDTGRKGRRDRYVIVSPSGEVDAGWHRAHTDKNPPGLTEAKWSAEVRAAAAARQENG